jgi:hypothetical protein
VTPLRPSLTAQQREELNVLLGDSMTAEEFEAALNELIDRGLVEVFPDSTVGTRPAGQN